MKQITFFVLLACLCTCVRSNAQKSTIILSIEGAPSVRWLTDNSNFITYQKPIPVLGFYGGITAQIPFSKVWSLVTGIGFERKGNALKSEETDFNGAILGTEYFYFNNDYWTMPVLVRASFGNKIKYFFNAGFYYGYLGASNLKIDRVDKSQNAPTLINNKSTMNSNDFGFSIGGGIRIKIAPKWTIPIEIRSNHGLVNTAKGPTIDNANIRTNATHLIVGLSYEFGKP